MSANGCASMDDTGTAWINNAWTEYNSLAINDVSDEFRSMRLSFLSLKPRQYVHGRNQTTMYHAKCVRGQLILIFPKGVNGFH